MPQRNLRILILGVGNPILGDDGVGPAVARRLHHSLPAGTADLVDAPLGGLELLELMVGYQRVILIDALFDPTGAVGTVHRIDRDPVHTRRVWRSPPLRSVTGEGQSTT